MYTAERFFVKTAHEQMCVLEAIWSPSDVEGVVAPSQTDTLPALEIIKASAQSVQARGVYRIASLCADVYARLGVDGAVKLRGSLASLKCLVYQYADGLFEIDPAYKAILIGEPQSLEENSQAAPHKDSNVVSFEAAHAKAASVLEPLLDFVKSKPQKQALTRLMGRADVAAKPVHKTQTFETMMRPITNLALSEARHSGKRVSISYAADFDDADRDVARHMQKFLEVLCLNIVGSGIGSERAQISLTGQMHKDTIGITVLWSGYDISDAIELNTHLKRAIADVRNIDGHVNIHTPALVKTGSTAQAATGNQSIEAVFPRALRATRTSSADALHSREGRLG